MRSLSLTLFQANSITSVQKNLFGDEALVFLPHTSQPESQCCEELVVRNFSSKTEFTLLIEEWKLEIVKWEIGKQMVVVGLMWEILKLGLGP